MEHLNTGIEGIEVDDIKGEGFSQEGRFRGMRVQEGSAGGRSGCIDSGSVWDILRSVGVGRFWVFRAVRSPSPQNPFRSRRGCFRVKLADDRVLPT